MSNVKDVQKKIKSKYFLEDPNPVYPLDIPDNFKYQTLILCHLEKKSISILYSNWEVEKPFNLSPEFEEDDLGENRLYLILTEMPLDIEEDEDFITEDRFEEILLQINGTSKKFLACIDISIEKRS
ncbi:hypothetical protein MTBBW1_2500023 [Desulfamplus magnetovallimortis]|uniref:Uncharacterized protein n=1 Tax=Desulfamplus magnetovallimortis TaxID=1246637 RepID=A0A1W1HEE3_9BACT|nr:hypothetical protein [Desulfamplus magnetovallimortis]SLM30874.1 hypothetical protein MTBBW1_2500023 [Desulfamplus magnetovallimortis]